MVVPIELHMDPIYIHYIVVTYVLAINTQVVVVVIYPACKTLIVRQRNASYTVDIRYIRYSIA